ncbi:MAG: cell division protein FtsK [Pelagibacteraceae bacterium]|nr:cell division protein FtsK [Pelagibacteraceae bacterium]
MVLKFNNSPDFSNIPFFKKRLLEIIGLILLIISTVIAASIITFNINDPSFSYLSDSATSNIFGKYGAYTSDLLIKLFGVSSILIFFIGFVWGLKLFIHKKITFLWLRLIFVPITLISTSTTLNIEKIFSVNLEGGGIVGKYTFLYITNFLQYINFEISQIYISISFFLISFCSFNFSLGLNQSDWIKISNSMFSSIKYTFFLFIKLINLIIVFTNKIFFFLKPIFLKVFNRKKSINVNSNSEAEDLFSNKKNDSKPGKLLKELIEPKFNFRKETDYELPKLDLLEGVKKNINTNINNTDLLQQNAKLLETVIKDYKIDAKVVGINPGPVVTLYELEPAPGTQTKRIINLTGDIARSMSAESARISNVRNKNAVGIELPNQEREFVNLKEIFGLKDFDTSNALLPLVFGKDISGKNVIQDLHKMPHLLIAGTTGSGKSVGLNAMILSILFSLRPDQCRFIMIDPKRLELSVYDEIPHLLTPVVTDPKKAIFSLKWLVSEMEKRYKIMSKIGVRNIESFNEKINQQKLNGEIIVEKTQTGFDSQTGKPIFEEKRINFDNLPYIVVIIDEIADLMVVSGKDVEACIQRLSQMARAAGIHLIVATQRPSTDVITGTIKANFSNRISYQVATNIDSRTIIGEQGAEYLLGHGDMLYMSGAGNIRRVHGPFVSDNEVTKVVKFLKSQGKPTYVDGVTDEKKNQIANNNMSGEVDELYSEAVELVITKKKASTSLVQRHFQIGYNRAARIIEKMEENNVVSEADRIGRREVLINK